MAPNFKRHFKGNDGAVQEDAAQERRRGIDFGPKDDGNPAGQNVADDAAADSGKDAEGDV